MKRYRKGNYLGKNGRNSGVMSIVSSEDMNFVPTPVKIS